MLENTRVDCERYVIVACAVFAREIYFRAATSKNIIDVILLDQGFHDIGKEGMSAKLQETIDSIDAEKYDALLLGYGLCNNGIVGLHAPIPMVVPRSHDCIGLLMGSKDRYREYFDANSGTYYRSSGWIERADYHLSNPDSTTSQMGMMEYDDYVEKYGEENARYLMEMFEGGLNHYSKLAYVDTKVGDFQKYIESERRIAEENGWEFDLIEGGTELFRRLLDGEWNEDDFLVVPSGQSPEPSHDDTIINTALEKSSNT
ncbi:MAG: DUF1638 domain-containing protein [Kiritimatiellaeota bacterium]|nr:DUF1638 domain-containing protein [Kiritimatiellota bacterium]